MRPGVNGASHGWPIVAGADDSAPPEMIDLSVASAARVYDYLLGGTAAFGVDREAVEHAWGSRPGGVDRGRADLRANRAFLVEAVRYLAAGAGIRQFVDIGALVPTPESVRGTAQEAVSSSRVVSVSHDPVVLAHAHQLRVTTPEGVADFVHGDLRDPKAIMQQAAATLDLSMEPVALILVGVVCLLSDDDDPHEVVAAYLNAVPPGSYLVMSHFAGDLDAEEEVAEIATRLTTAMRESFAPRTHAQVCRFFDGLDVLGPGVVPLNDWQLPETEPIRVGDQIIRYYGGIGRKPTSAPSLLAPSRYGRVNRMGERR